MIERLDGHITQYLGDGILVYFGYPQAHEDDAHRAGRAGLGMVAAMQALNIHLAQRHGVRVTVRIGIYTDVIVVGEMGGGNRQEQLALGDTPNMAARLQGLAAPVPVYRLLGESGVQSRMEALAPSRLTPLVGREGEVALLHQRWEQAKAGQGQVVLLSGIEWRGSSYHQQSALYSVIVHQGLTPPCWRKSCARPTVCRCSWKNSPKWCWNRACFRSRRSATS